MLHSFTRFGTASDSAFKQNWHIATDVIGDQSQRRNVKAAGAIHFSPEGDICHGTGDDPFIASSCRTCQIEAKVARRAAMHSEGTSVDSPVTFYGACMLCEQWGRNPNPSSETVQRKVLRPGALYGD